MLDDEMRMRDEHVKKTLITTAGFQEGEPELYFLNPEQIIDLSSGEMIDPESASLVWIPNWNAASTSLPRAELCHVIQTPTSLGPYRVFLDKAKEVLLNNFGAALLAWASMLMMFRYPWTLRHIRHFNLPMLFGVPSVGKTLVATCGAWLTGCQETQIASRCTLPYLIQRLISSSMPFVWDDPTNPEEVGQLAVDLGNGAVRGKLTEMPQVPLTGCLVTANFDLTSVSRYSSRLCILKMERIEGPKQPGVASVLENLAASASSALPILLKAIHHISPEEVHNCTRELMDKVPCDLRVLEGLSVPLTAARKVLEISGRRQYLEAIEVYLEDTLFPYISASMPGNQTLPTIIMEKVMDHSEQVVSQTEMKEEKIKIVRSFLLDTVGLSEGMLTRLKAEGSGDPSKVVRMKGQLLRAVVINVSDVREDIRQRFIALHSGEQMLNNEEETEREPEETEREPEETVTCEQEEGVDMLEIDEEVAFRVKRPRTVRSRLRTPRVLRSRRK